MIQISHILKNTLECKNLSPGIFEKLESEINTFMAQNGYEQITSYDYTIERTDNPDISLVVVYCEAELKNGVTAFEKEV